MRKLRLLTIIVVILAGGAWWYNPSILADLGFVKSDDELIVSAWQQEKSNFHVQFEARVILKLPDEDNYGNAQKFLVVLENGHRLLISHDLEISTRVPIVVNSLIRVKGEYDWNETGGMVHWTHRDINNERDGGWIELNNHRYR
jgi:hypothetical protein